MAGQATPYDLKQMASRTVGEFWTLPHSQLYSEPARLARADYLTEQQEPHGRRRKLYTLTPRGQQSLTDWLQTFAPEPYMLRDPALLKLFFGADPHQLAEIQLQTHRQKLTDYEALREQLTEEAPIGPRLALELGIRHERETVDFWAEHTPS
jgi:DNA-binding PadR family transcriptional regulator